VVLGCPSFGIGEHCDGNLADRMWALAKPGGGVLWYDVPLMLQKFRRLQIGGVQGEAVYVYRESWTTKKMRPPKLSRRVKIDRYFS